MGIGCLTLQHAWVWGSGIGALLNALPPALAASPALMQGFLLDQPFRKLDSHQPHV